MYVLKKEHAQNAAIAPLAANAAAAGDSRSKIVRLSKCSQMPTGNAKSGSRLVSWPMP